MKKEEMIVPKCIKCEKGLSEIKTLHILHNTHMEMHICVCTVCYKKYNESQIERLK